MQNYEFCTKNTFFCTEWVPICPFATKIAANYMTFRPRPVSKSNLTRKIILCRDNPEKMRGKNTGRFLIFSHHQPDVGSRFNDTIPSSRPPVLAFLRILLLLAFLAIDIIDPSSSHSIAQSISLDSLTPLEDSASILTSD